MVSQFAQVPSRAHNQMDSLDNRSQASQYGQQSFYGNMHQPSYLSSSVERQYPSTRQAQAAQQYLVSDEDRVNALLSTSSSTDNLHALDHNMSDATRIKTDVDWYSSPYYQQDLFKQYQPDAQNLPAHEDQLRQTSYQTGTAVPSSEYDEREGASFAFQPFADEDFSMDTDYMYGEDEYDGQKDLNRHVSQEELRQDERYEQLRHALEASSQSQVFHGNQLPSYKDDALCHPAQEQVYQPKVSPNIDHFQAPSVFQEDLKPVTGICLSAWLAESVWNLCYFPFEPTLRKGEIHTDGFLARHNHGQQWSGYSSPGSFSVLEVNDRASSTPAQINPFGLAYHPSGDFVEFIRRTLGQTLLCPTSIMLSLWYIRRLAIHSGGGDDGMKLRQMLRRASVDVYGRGGEGAVQRVLTLGLACSNKWLSDNTFTNRSWSDVTQLPLSELNTLELFALGPLKFDLSLDVSEWEDWLHDVEKSLTPFSADVYSVASAINSMHIALFESRVRFQQEISDRREAPLQRAYSFTMTPQPLMPMTLPPLSTVINRNLSAYPDYGADLSVYGLTSTYGYKSDAQVSDVRSYGESYAVPPSAASLAPPQMASSRAYGGAVQGQASAFFQNGARQPRQDKPYRANISYGQSGSICHQPNYFTNLASRHQPRLMSVVA